MSSILKLRRVLRVRPAELQAYTCLSRYCSNGATSSNNNSGGTPSPSPASKYASLDLGLNFAAMDFEAVAKATHAAITRERGVSGAALAAQREQGMEERLEQQCTQRASQASHDRAAPSAVAAESTKKASTSLPRGAPRGGGQGFTRDARSSVASPRRRESGGGDGRYSLLDRLRDCQVEGNWAKAYHLFTNAVSQSCRQVLIPRGAEGGAGVGESPSLSSRNDEAVDPAREAECFAALRKMLAALPPFDARDQPATVARGVNARNLRGITRWNGQHYYMLWKCLLEAGHVEEVCHVWTVMQQIGFADYAMQEKTVNVLMTLLRRTSYTVEQTSAHVVSSAVPHTTGFDERVEREKAMRRELVKGLEQVAAARRFHLVGSNRRTAESIRIAEALQRAEDADAESAEKTDSTAQVGHSSNNTDGSTTGTATATAEADEPSAIAVGDFNGLLRRSRSMESTQRVLQMMSKLNLELESSTFASLIAAMHNPMYVLEGHTAEEIAAHQTVHAGGNTRDAPAAADSTVSGDAGDTKLQYEAYKQERVETALQWFFQCPKSQRNADVYNELLYLLRSKSYWRDFDKVLVEYRGNAVLTEEEWPESTPAPHRSESAAAGELVQATPAAEVSPILSAQWTTPPNGKTYELLLQRARYVHQWDVMWALYEEMTACGVRGTTRLYEVLLTEARRHPPRTLHGVKMGTSAKESSEMLMRLYDDLRRNGGDVHSFKSTLNVVDAWSKSRARANRWE